jgi:catechol 2,3-dioxygenase-like lactoylglutathione lyase family enzyme
VRATRINHVSISARDLEESARFYEELFGLERLPTPSFGNPVVWLRLGDGQLHLFERDEHEAPRFHHLGLEVDDFEAFYVRLTELGIRDSDSLGPIRELPSGEVQMYLRDPGGNLVEVDSPGVGRLPDSIRAELRRLADVHPQDEENESARLYVGGAGATV